MRKCGVGGGGCGGRGEGGGRERWLWSCEREERNAIFRQNFPPAGQTCCGTFLTACPAHITISIQLHGVGELKTSWYRHVGLVVKASASRAEDPGFECCLRRDFFEVESLQ